YGYMAFDPLYTIPVGPVNFSLNKPGQLNSFGNAASSFVCAAQWVNEIWYGVLFEGAFVTINPTSGQVTAIGPCPSFVGIAYDYTTETMYGVSWIGDLCTIDLATGLSTKIANTQWWLIALACTNDGTLYGFDGDANTFGMIDKTTGAWTVISNVGFDFNNAQDACVDRETNTIYWATYSANLGGQLLTIDATTGVTSFIGSFPNACEVDGFAIPSPSWIKINSHYGSINAGGSGIIEVLLNAKGLLPGSTHEADIHFTPDPNIGEKDVHVTLEILAPSVLQNILLPKGWSGWSSYIEPVSDATFADVVAPVVNNIIISQYFGSLFWPIYNINTMGAFSNEHGYLTKMSNESILTLYAPVAGSTISLNAGWNLIPVISTCNVPAAQLLNIPGFIIAWEIAGNGIYYPAGGIHTLHALIPGKAYYVKVSQSGQFTFPECDATSSNSYLKPVRSENITSWNDVNYTGTSHSVVFSEEAVSQLATGDVIGAFTSNGLCAGMIIVTENTVAMSLFADDISTGTIDGFIEGEVLNFKVMRPSTGELFILDVTYNTELPNNDGLFATNGLSVFSNLSLKATNINTPGMSGISIYPNPSTGVVNISGIKTGTNIIITDLQGQSLFMINTTIKNACQIDLTGYHPGVYFIKIEMNGNSIFRKLILQ
ncbi:MAG: T9SS type A sorting domain-containing protein, partial [Bacteroidales bacterium]